MNRIRLAVALALGWAASASADDWGEVAQISTTLGVQANRLCLGEASRGDIGCPTYAPYVSSGGLIGIGTSAPSNTLTISRAVSVENNIEIRGDHSTAYRRIGGIILNRSLWDPSGEAAAIDFYRGGSAREGEIVFRTNPGASAGVSATEYMRLTQYGYLGIRTSYPSTSLHVSGTIRMANDGQACDTNRAGAVRWHAGAGQFQVCYGSGGWALLSSAAVSGTLGTTPDRIVSGTSSVIAGQDRSVTISTAGSARMVVGENGRVGIGTVTPIAPAGLHIQALSGEGNPALVSGEALRVQRNSANNAMVGMSLVAGSQARAGLYFGDNGSAGSGAVVYNNLSDSMSLNTNGSEKVRILSGGNVGIGTTEPSATLDVSGTVKIAGTGAESCTMGTLGQIRLNPTSGKFEVCRQ